jgi:ubiquinone/menaquinone biosynthesis C-methylase UbiE
VIGYLNDPSQGLNEFVRVLAPGGKLVLTNLKPHADLSQIYRNFVQKTEEPQEVEEARQLLNNAGKIKQGESEGIFRFYDRQELLMVLISTGAVNPRIYSTFANQAYIAVVEKPGIGSEIQFQKDREVLTLSL